MAEALHMHMEVQRKLQEQLEVSNSKLWWQAWKTKNQNCLLGISTELKDFQAEIC
jgi:hypothetical protein